MTTFYYFIFRLKVGKTIEKKNDAREVERNIHLIKSPAAGLLQKRALEMEVAEEESEEEETEEQEAEEMEVL